jgi:hypothetical protein
LPIYKMDIFLFYTRFWPHIGCLMVDDIGVIMQTLDFFP